MSWSLLASGIEGSPDTNGFTSQAYDTTGANLLLVVRSYYTAINSVTISDTKSNSWFGACLGTVLTDFAISTYYAFNPIVGTGHQFITGGNQTFPTLAVLAWSGATTTDPLDGSAPNSNSSAVSVTTLSTGSVTPTQDNSLIIAAAIGVDNPSDVSSIDLSFTLQLHIAHDGTNHQSAGSAYLLQGSAAAVNPTFTFSSATRCAAAIVAFKPASGTTFILVPGR